MIAFKDFDLAASFSIDYMHGILLGITKLLLDIWLGSRKLRYEEGEIYRFKLLNPEQRIKLNQRIIGLKSKTQIRHKPRPIFGRNFYTANEYRSMLWYYLRFSLYGLLKKELIKHFVLISDATYISEVQKAGSMLCELADKFEYFYGENACTINLHILRHYAHSVLRTVPLWCHSMFAFESNIGEIKRSFNCTVDVIEQNARNCSIKAAEQNIQTTSKIPQILRQKLKNLTLEQEL